MIITKRIFSSNLGGPSPFLDISETRTGIGHLDQEPSVSWKVPKAYCQVLPLFVPMSLQGATLLAVLFLPSLFISKEFRSLCEFIDYVMGICVGKLAPAPMVGWAISGWCPVHFVSHPFRVDYKNWSWVEGVERGMEGHLLITVQFIAIRDKWLAGCTVTVEKRSSQLNLGFIIFI